MKKQPRPMKGLPDTTKFRAKAIPKHEKSPQNHERLLQVLYNSNFRDNIYTECCVTESLSRCFFRLWRDTFMTPLSFSHRETLASLTKNIQIRCANHGFCHVEYPGSSRGVRGARKYHLKLKSHPGITDFRAKVTPEIRKVTSKSCKSFPKLSKEQPLG